MPTTISDQIKSFDGPDISKPIVVINEAALSELAPIPDSIFKVLGPVGFNNILYTTPELLRTDFPHLSEQQIADFAAGFPFISLLVPTQIRFDAANIEDDRQNISRQLREALAVNIFLSAHRLIGCEAHTETVQVIGEMADACWHPRFGDDGMESIAAFRGYFLDKLYNEGLIAAASWYPDNAKLGDITAALNAEGKHFGTLVYPESASTIDRFKVDKFRIDQFHAVTNLFRLYRRAQDVEDLLNLSPTQDDIRGRTNRVSNIPVEPSFSKGDLLLGAYHGNFDPSTVSPRHTACRQEFDEMRLRGVSHRAATFDRFRRSATN